MTVIQQLNGVGLYLIAGGIILFIACQKFFIKGATAGAVKG